MSDPPHYYRRLASIEWSHAQRRANVEKLLGTLRLSNQTLVPFEQVRSGLKLRHRSYRGTQLVPLDSIVGSVGRYRDFSRTFLPRTKTLRQRWERVSSVMTAQGTPPIQLYKVGDAYFVADGNHRVSVARVHGADSIEAEVWEYETNVALGDDLTVDQVILEAERLEFLERTRLDELRPAHTIAFTEPGRYIELEYQIALYQQVLERIDGEACPFDKAVAAWYDMVYEPTIAIIRSEDILRYFPGRTEADLFAWISRHRRRLRKRYGGTVSIRDVTQPLRGRGPLAALRRLLANLRFGRN